MQLVDVCHVEILNHGLIIEMMLDLVLSYSDGEHIRILLCHTNKVG
jgi:hypothetical protein